MSKRAKADKVDNNQCQYVDQETGRCDRKACNGVEHRGRIWIFCKEHVDTAREAADA